MKKISDILLEHRMLFAPLISIVLSALIVAASLYSSVPYLYMAVPVVTFFIFYSLHIHKIKPRILGSLVVFIVTAIIAAAIFSGILYSASGQSQVQYLENGSAISTSVTPYRGPSASYNFSFSITGNTSFTSYSMVVRDLTDSSVKQIFIPQNRFNSSMSSNGTLNLYIHLNNITKKGIYGYYLFLNNNTTLYASNLGPLITSYENVFSAEILDFVQGYLIVFELIFLVGIFLGRSLSHSLLYGRRIKPPPRIRE